MTCFAVWMDRDQARILQFSGHQHENLEDLKVLKKPSFEDLARQLISARQILLAGPCMAKFHFNNFLVEQHPLLSKKVIACENLDEPSDAWIASKVATLTSRT